MANVSLWGAVYADVPQVLLPKSGGGTAQFDDTSDADATAADIASGKTAYVNGQKITGTGSGGGVTVEALSVTQNGTYTAPTGTAYSPVTVNVSGGGGSSNVVTGTFKGTTANAAMDITLNYSGAGYPIAFMIYPTAGFYNQDGPYYSLVQRYAIGFFAGARNDMEVTTFPARAVVASVYKSNASSSNAYTRNGSQTATSFQDAAATASYSAAVKIRSSTKMSVYIAGTSYGFPANIEYTYHVIYSK